MKNGFLISLLITSLLSCQKEETNSTGKMIFSFDFSNQSDNNLFNSGTAILIEYQYLGKGTIVSKKIDLSNIGTEYSFYKYSSPIEFKDKEVSYKVLKYSLIDSQGNEIMNVPDSTALNSKDFDLLIPFYIQVYKNQTTMIRPKME